MTFQLWLVKETAAARLFSTHKPGPEIWIPRSQTSRFLKFPMTPQDNGQHRCEIEIPEWLAEAKGLA